MRQLQPSNAPQDRAMPQMALNSFPCNWRKLTRVSFLLQTPDMMCGRGQRRTVVQPHGDARGRQKGDRRGRTTGVAPPPRGSAPSCLLLGSGFFGRQCSCAARPNAPSARSPALRCPAAGQVRNGRLKTYPSECIMGMASVSMSASAPEQRKSSDLVDAPDAPPTFASRHAGDRTPLA